MALVALLTMVSAACGDDDSTAASGTAAATSLPPGTETAAQASVTVSINDKAFSTDDVVVQTGGTVTWANSDTVDHEIVSLGSDVIRSPVLGQGGSYTALFTVPGEYPYYCNIYNFMKGTVVVR